MQPDNDWDTASAARGFPGFGLLKPTLLFGSAAIALALIVAPMLDTTADTPDFADAGSLPEGLDFTSTGSIAPSRGAYTIRRSVLQASPDSICVIRSNGQRAGDC